ncbi:MAG: protein phosphatase 2C domain-containing protein [Pyrinomonadaceae bacterium]|nr:protein phosphatase 2C domain-containing protein [Pyrinomonadaceae bacterium]
MSHPDNKTHAVEVQTVTDRGLNERRPLNEDSLLADRGRFIFAVADGVGGAEAGEVASQTAIEVLDEAFRHQAEGDDVEDLMELAIQRANASIHQMAQEHAKFSMMATTIVALHLKGNIATIGHVGDSRLYRLTVEGDLVRETEDHSVVEEEVRAGRMTAEQAAHHPSKNVISRALGAEESVEVDLKTIEVEDGTEFLLCTDGITRHISDAELRQLLVTQDSLKSLCDELKRRCYERGAEDNLTAVVVRYGQRIPADGRLEDLQRTISPETETVAIFERGARPPAAGNFDLTEDALAPSARLAFATAGTSEEGQISTPERKLNIPAPNASKGGFLRAVGRLFLFIVFLAAVGGAFYAGRRYKGPIPFLKDENEAVAQVSPNPLLAEDPLLKFERTRSEIDSDPNSWLSTQVKAELTRQGVSSPLESSDPEFLYLYGRASLLAGNSVESAQALELAIVKSDLTPSPRNSTIRKEATLALAALALKFVREKPRASRHLEEILSKPVPGSSP